MHSANILGFSCPIKKIFCNDFVFNVPLYQRPYLWTTDHAEALLDDLLTFVGNGDQPVDELNPYFLGSIVLIKGDQPDAQIVDGQQRLSTLTILFAALRAQLNAEHAKSLTTFLYEEGNSITGTPNRYRLSLRERDTKFFREYIQNKGGIEKLKILPSNVLSDSQKTIRANTLKFCERLEKLTDSQQIRLAQFIANRCFLVVVITPDLDSAYQIFSILNDRGLDLSHTDILKAEIIGAIPEYQQKIYTEKWEEAEEKLERDDFQDLFAHIRTIYRKVRARDPLLKEFRLYVNPAANPQKFIDEILLPFTDAFDEIKTKSYQDENEANTINSLFDKLNRIDNFDWAPSAILYLSRNRNKPDSVEKFFSDLERLAASLMIRRANVNERTERYAKVLEAIDKEENLFAPISLLQLTIEEKSETIKILDGDLYLIEKVRLYVLLRLDEALSEVEAKYNYPVITVEHVLPQTPSLNSKWVQWFPDLAEREKNVHRLGNLVLLSRRKNSEASRYDFEQKKQKYFIAKNSVSRFALTTTVLQYDEWTPRIIAQRQVELLNVLKNVWRLV